MTKITDIPAIRFKGFSDTWEQRKLGEVFQEYSEKNHPELPALTIIQGGGTVLREESERKLQYDKSSLAGYKMVREDDFIVHLRSFEGGLEKSNHNGLISPAYHTFHGDEVDSRFYYPYFRSYEFIKHKLVPHVYGIRDGRSIDIDSMKTIEIPWTSYEEQKKIGDYIESLDTLITLHQRKYDKLTNVKKSMLEKMFPQNGSNAPEIRFKGFTEAWEQRKVTEIGKIYIGLVTTMTKHYTDEGILLIRNSDIKDGKFEFGDNPIYLEKTFAEKNETRMHQIGDVITVHTGDVGTSAVITENEAKSIGFATIVTRPNPKIIDSNYLCSFLNTDKHKKWAVSISTGDGRTNYNLGDYFELVVPVPSIAEQKKIASYIQKLNRLITLHQRELEKLKNLKKACLEKMFV